jgi:hypothetical protein
VLLTCALYGTPEANSGLPSARMTVLIVVVTHLAIAGPMATVCAIALICVLALAYIAVSDRKHRNSQNFKKRSK